MELISVIVPVYKVEAYLDKCIASIVNQTYKNLEIILVDDGSPDQCGAICDAWAAKDSRIRVIHQNNAGGGAARNAALEIAAGNYIGFVDSDDYLAPQMYEHLMRLMDDGVDIAECGYCNTWADTAEWTTEGEVRIASAEEAMYEHIRDRVFRQVIWNKLYRRECIGDIRFPVGKRIDDEFWTYRVIANAENLVHSPSGLYAYRQQPDSVMHAAFSLARLQALDAKCQRLEFLQSRFPELVAPAKINLWQTCLYLGQMSFLHLCKEEKQGALDKLAFVLKKYSLTKYDRRILPHRQKMWAILSDLSFAVVCKLRNCLKIGT